MTKILAIDTSTSACSVAVNVGGRIEEEFTLAPQDHTQRLLPMVDRLLAQHQLSLGQLDAIAFTQGPGSFTGLRICVGVVQGLAFGADLPVIPVSTLQVMAAGAAADAGIPSGAILAPALDARMQEIYWGLYSARADLNESDCLVADTVSGPDQLLEALSGYDRQDGAYVLGSACPLLDAEKTGALNIHLRTEIYPHARDLARLAEPLLKAGKLQSALDASPVYVRNEVSWVKRRKIRQSNS